MRCANKTQTTSMHINNDIKMPINFIAETIFVRSIIYTYQNKYFVFSNLVVRLNSFTSNVSICIYLTFKGVQYHRCER